MEREILFRGKPMFREIDEFVYGYYKQGDIAGVKTDFILPLPEYKNEINEVAVCPMTVGQYTGLTDRNGVRIFEGDIISYNGSKEVVYFDTSLNIPCFTTGIGRGSSTVPHPYKISKRHVVIGNIHDNPELLKGEK